MARRRASTTHQNPKVHARTKSCKPIFSGLVFVLSGDLGLDRPHASIELWIKNHAGSVEKDVDENTTHLVCSVTNFKAKVAPVKKALEMGAKCKIVGWEFIEDCLIGPGGPKKLSDRPYQLYKALSRLRSAERRVVAIKNKFEDDIELTKELVDKALYHIYMDELFFEYNIVLTRITWNELTGKHITDKWTIFLFESNAKPCSYMVGGKFRTGRRPTALYRDRCFPMLFCDAFKAFKGLFRKLTGIEWDQRCDGVPQMPGRYRYMVPTNGKVVGVLPLGWTPPQQAQTDLGTDEETATEEMDSSDPDLTDNTNSQSSKKEAEDDKPMTVNPYTPGVTLSELQTQLAA